MAIWYRKRKASQWNLYAEMIDRLASTKGTSWREEHRGIKVRYYPREGDIGVRTPKESSELNVVEMGHIIEGAVIECSQNDPPVDIQDIYTLWIDWRHTQEGGDPLEGTYKTIADYLERHPFCEACGRGLANDEGGREGQMDHIVPVGEGGPDDDWNRLRLCTDCHIMVKHDDGALELIFVRPSVKKKVMAAWRRCGKSDIETRLGRVHVHFENEEEEESPSDDLGLF